MTAPLSLDLYVRRFENFLPARVLLLVEGSEGVRRHLLGRRDVLAEILHAMADVRVLEGGDRGGIQPGDDLVRRALGRPQTVPDRDLHRIARLGSSLDLRRG